MTKSLFIIHILLFGVLVVSAKDVKMDKKEAEALSSSPYNKEWQAELKSYLPVENLTLLEQDTIGAKKTSINKHLNSTDDISATMNKRDSFRFKKSTNTSNNEITKKDIVFQIDTYDNNDKKLKHLIAQRQNINTPGEITNTNIGKPYGDSDNYQPIGDGVYLIRSGSKPQHNSKDLTVNAKIKTITAKLPDTSKALGSIMGNLNQEDNDILDASKRHSDVNAQSIALENAMATSSEVVGSSSNQIPSSADNIEGIQPKELNLISDIQNNLKAEDKNADLNINDQAYAANRSPSLDFDNGQSGLLNIAKAVQDSDKDFIRDNPLAIDPESKHGAGAKEFIKNQLVDPDDENVPTVPMYKKDLTETKEKHRPVSFASSFVDSVNAADKNIQNFAAEDSSLDKRARDIVNFAANEDAHIMVGGSRSRKPKQRKRRKHRHHKRHRNSHRKLNNVLKHDTDDINEDVLRQILNAKHKEDQNLEATDSDEMKNIMVKGSEKVTQTDDGSDTGFFMADENDMAALNKKTEDFVAHTVNASFVDIIESSGSKIASKKDNLTSSDNKIALALGALEPDEPIVANITDYRIHRKLTGKKRHQEKVAEQNIDKDDIKLYDTLNKTVLTKLNRHHSGSVWKVSNNNKPTKVINVAGKPGVQIDLYITGNKGKKYKKKMKVHRITPKGNIQGVDMNDMNGIEDVSLDEVVNNQEKQMFANTPTNVYGTDKTSVDEIQTNHVEGNEGKQGGDVSIQDAINSEELKTAMTASDLKGLNDIKNELDLQDAKNTVDFFNQPDTAKSLAHHIETTNMKDLTKQIKEAETGVETESVRPKGDEDPQKVKIILHIPEAIAKQKDLKTQETITSIADQAKAFLSTDKTDQINAGKLKKKRKMQDRVDEATMAAAKKIEDFIKLEASKEDEEEKENNTGEALINGKKQVSLKDKDETNTENILNALLKASSSLHDNSPRPANSAETFTNTGDEITKIKEENPKENEPETTAETKEKDSAKALENLNGLKEETKGDSVLSFHSADNPHPTAQLMQNFIKTTHDQALSKETVKPTDALLPVFSSNQMGTSQLRINGGKVIGGNVRGGSILGGVVSGGDVSGGEIRGGMVKGGTFKSGLLIDGEVDNGVVEGGKIRGGKIVGGDIKSGIIDGGVVKGGIFEGGHLINGTVEGGDFKGGEIRGGRLISGEMDGGILKDGTINGGVLRGGVIESGSLDGGVMFAGILRGGVVKSGIIRGGIIDKGVIVQDAEIGPGVEIHDGIVKGGRISVSAVPQVTATQEATFNSPVPETIHTDENRSNIMYTLEVLPKPTDTFKASVIKSNITQKDSPMSMKVIVEKQPVIEDETKNETKGNAFLEKSLSSMNGPAKNPTPVQQHVIHEPEHEPKHSPKRQNNYENTQQQKKKHSAEYTLRKKPSVRVGSVRTSPNNAHIQRLLNQLEISAKKAELEQTQQATAKMYANYEKRRNEQASATEDRPIAHWELSQSKNNIIKGNPGPELRVSGGVRIHNGHAILDGINGYMDAGDYRGECFSDPEACDNGFTIQMTLKIYRDSVFNTSRMFIIDSGAWSKDSRGISVYVSDGRIGGMVVTRDEIWCIHKILEPYIGKWMSITITWRQDKGLQLHINCDLFDQSLPHSASECDQCTTKGGCHKTDVATRLMFGRPNKGPHFKVIHMAVGEITLYERYSDKNEVKQICGSKENPPKESAVASIIQTPSKAAALVSFLKHRQQTDEEGGYSWPTPSTLNARKIQEGKVSQLKKTHNDGDDDDNENPWPTPGRLARPSKIKPTPTSRKTLVDPNTDRRSAVHDNRLDGGYASWMEWSPCSQSCGKGVQISVRYCTNPSPKIGGKDCYHIGPPRKFRSCVENDCPITKEAPFNDNEYGTKKSSVPDQQMEPMIIVNGQQKSLQELETAFEQLKHRRK